MKLDKEYKNEVNKTFKEADYVGSRIFIRVVLYVLIICMLSSAGYFIYGRIHTNAERNIFKQSVAYNEAAGSFLAKSYSEYNSTESDSEKKAIMQYVVDRYPNLDSSKIENSRLAAFYNKCILEGN